MKSKKVIIVITLAKESEEEPKEEIEQETSKRYTLFLQKFIEN